MALRSSSNTKRKHEYIQRTAADIKSRADQKIGEEWDSVFKKGVDIFKPKLGDNSIRILEPTWEFEEGERKHYGKNVWIHAFVGIENGSYVCLKKMKKERCPICEAAQEAKSAGDDNDAKKLTAKCRVVMWLINRDADDPTIPEIYSMSQTMDRDIAAICSDPRTGKVLYIDHFDCGFDVYFRGEQKVFNAVKFVNPAAYQIAREESPIADDDKTVDKIRDYIWDNPVTSMLNYQTPEYLEKIMSGTSESRDEELDEEEETKPAERSTKRGNAEAIGEDEEIKSNRRRTRHDTDKGEAESEDEAIRRPRQDHDDDEEERKEITSAKHREADEEEEEEEEETTTKEESKKDDEEIPTPRQTRRQQNKTDSSDEEEQTTRRTTRRSR